VSEALRQLPPLIASHVLLAAAAMGLALLIGLPLGLASARRARLAAFSVGFAGLVQTIPGLALLALFYPLLLALSALLGGGLPALGFLPALLALTLYALLPILRNTVTGIDGIDAALREAAVGMGMTDGQLLRRLELPLAASVILAGIRLATVIGVGVATIAAPIGAGVLGTLVFSGVASLDNQRILAGAIPAAGLALVADTLLGAVERRFRWAT